MNFGPIFYSSEFVPEIYGYCHLLNGYTSFIRSIISYISSKTYKFIRYPLSFAFIICNHQSHKLTVSLGDRKYGVKLNGNWKLILGLNYNWVFRICRSTVCSNVVCNQFFFLYLALSNRRLIHFPNWFVCFWFFFQFCLNILEHLSCSFYRSMKSSVQLQPLQLILEISFCILLHWFAIHAFKCRKTYSISRLTGALDVEKKRKRAINEFYRGKKNPESKKVWNNVSFGTVIPF